MLFGCNVQLFLFWDVYVSVETESPKQFVKKFFSSKLYASLFQKFFCNLTLAVDLKDFNCSQLKNMVSVFNCNFQLSFHFLLGIQIFTKFFLELLLVPLFFEVMDFVHIVLQLLEGRQVLIFLLKLLLKSFKLFLLPLELFIFKLSLHLNLFFQIFIYQINLFCFRIFQRDFVLLRLNCFRNMSFWFFVLLLNELDQLLDFDVLLSKRR